MPDLIVCPDQDKLSQLLNGAASEEEIDSFAQHLETCSTCAQRVEETEASSPIRNVMWQPAQTAPLVVDGRMQAMMERLDKMASVPFDPQQTTATPCPKSHEIQTSVEGIRADDDTEQDYLAWLDPTKDASELGRLGAYRILKILGVGGMGVVYQAEDTTLKRTVALKAMKPSMASNNSARQRFLREAQTAAAVRHDNVVTIYQAGEHNQIAFLAMEYLEGESLEDRLKREKHLTVAETLRIGQEIAEGLAAAHAHDLIHRDIKPSNLWLEQGRGRVKILDFGLARAAVGNVKLTQSGTILGTPAYMAPEQAEGETVNARADLFSLGCVLYRMATGELPFKGEGVMQILRAIALTKPREPHEVNPEISSELSTLIMKLLEKDPAKRIATAGEVVAALQIEQDHLKRHLAIEDKTDAVKSDEQVTTRNASNTTKAANVRLLSGRTRRKKSSLLVAIAFLFGLVVCASAIYGIIRISTAEGDYVINTDNPDFSFSVSKGIVVLHDKKTKQEYKLRVVKQKGGEFWLEVTDPINGLAFNTKAFSIKRGEVVALKAWFERKSDSIEPKIVPPPIPAGLAGEPLSSLALVRKPATIKGAKSWTIESVVNRDLVFPRPGYAAFDPSGARIALYGSDGVIRLHNTRNGRLEQCLIGDGGSPGGDWSGWTGEGKARLAWSKDERFLATCSANENTFIVWDTSTGSKLQSFDRFVATCLAWSPDGKLLATGNGDDVVIWDRATGKKANRFVGGKEIDDLTWSPHGEKIAAANRKGRVWVWDLKADKLLSKWSIGKPGVDRAILEWSPDNTRLVHYYSSRMATDVTIWSIERGEKLGGLKIETNRGSFGQTVDFAPLHFIWAEDGRTLRGVWAARGFWNLAASKWTRPLQPEALLRVHPEMGSPDPQVWSADGKRWYVLGQIWSLDTGMPVSVWGKRPDEFLIDFYGQKRALSPNGMYCAVASADNIVRIVNPRTGEVLIRKRLDSRKGIASDLAWSPDSQRLLVIRRSSPSVIFDLKSKQWTATASGPKGFLAPWSPDSKLVTIGDQERLRVCDADSGAEVRSFPNSELGDFYAICPTATLVAATRGKGGIRIYDYAKNKPIPTEDGPPFNLLAWSPDGKRVVAIDLGGKFAIWEIGTGKIIAKSGVEKVPGRGIPFPEAQFGWAADGKEFYFVMTDGTYSWDASTGNLLRKSPAKPVSDTGGNRLRYVPLLDEQFIAISPEGHYRGTPDAERYFVYVVETERGQETLTPAAMEKKYGWKNDPDKVRLTDK